MSSHSLKALFVQLVVFASGVCAQQFAGTPISNSLPSVPTSEITYWNIPDANNHSTTLINYSSLSKSFQRLNATEIERAVIIVHGLDRDPWDYMSEGMAALQTLTGQANINQDTVQIVAPYFTNGNDKNFSYPWNYSAPAGGKGSYTNCLVWYSSNWINGANNQYPYNKQSVSSYAVLDAMIQYYDNKALYPNLKQIVVAGHSAGAQAIQRYAAVGNVLNTTTPVSFWVANPDSLLWFSASRPLDTSDCPTYDAWRDGLSNYTNTYGAALVAQGRSAVLSRYNARHINYARGTLDLGDDASTCGPYTTGANRNERFFEFIKAFPVTCTKGACDTIDYVPVGHDSGEMMSSTAGQNRLFVDNWTGTGSQAYDYGCPRLQSGDNPWPNPKCTTTAIPADNGTYSGYTYMGCYTDAAFYKTLSYTAYTGQASATIQTCVAACSAANYTLAGAEYGDECYCGDTMYWDTFGPLPEQSCTMNCTGIGNSSQICGDSERISVFSKKAKTPVIAAAPSVPSMVKGWAFEGCYTEVAPGVRALTGASEQTTSMTIETCVAFCSSKGYTIAGAEYASQCYCGTSLQTGANLTYTPECDMACQGNASEFCGGSSLLSVYANPAYWGSNLTVNGSTSSTSASASTTTAGPLVSATGALSCPDSNGLGYTAGGSVWDIECYLDRPGSDLSVAYSSTLEGCISACASTSGCVDVSWVPGTSATSPCYLKSAIGPSSNSTSVWGARYYSASNSSTTTTASSNYSMTSTTSSRISSTTVFSNTTITSSATTSHVASSTVPTSYVVAATPLSCPTSNNETYSSGTLVFLMECYVDRAGGDLGFVYTSSYQGCADACANTTGCVDLSWVPGSSATSACYMKSVINPAASNTAVWGARVIGTTSVANSTKTASTTASTISTTSASASFAPTSVTSFANSSSTSTKMSSSSTSSFATAKSSSTSAKSSSSSAKSTSTSAKTTSTSAKSSSSSSSAKIISSSTISNTTLTTSTQSSTGSATLSSSSSASKNSTSTASTTSSSLSSTTSLITSSSPTTNSTSSATSTISTSSSPKASSTSSKSTSTAKTTSATSKTTSTAKTSSTSSKVSTTSKTSISSSSSSSASATATAAILSLRKTYSNWTLEGCYNDTTTHTTLPHNITTLGGTANMTIPNCLAACAKANFTWCGAENSTLCFGATTAPNTTLLLTPTASPVAAGCNVACRGNASEACGGAGKVVVYKL